jgi:LysM repeat protein
MVISAPPAVAPPAAHVPASVVAARPAPHGWTTYTVRNGDTLIGIAARFRTTVGVLAARNHLHSPHQIFAGATLSVPRTSAARPAGGGTASTVHVVRGGETLIGIAAHYRVPLASVLKANHLRASAFIYPGQKIRVRGAAASATAARTAAKGSSYTVRPGDTLGSIAIRSRTSVAAIARASGISTRSLLQVGQRLTLPGRAGKASTRTSVPDTFNGVTYPRSVAEAAARNRATLARRSVPSRSETRAMIISTAHRHGVDARLALAIAYQESGWNQRAVSPANAVGVMQIIPEAGRWASQLAGRRLDLLRTQDNITAGVVMLRSLGRSTHRMEDAVGAYYQGLGALQQHGMYSDTKLYVRNVMLLRKTM